MDYTLISLSSTLAHVQFNGKLNNKDVIWNAEIQTLNSTTDANSKSGIRQYIDIEITEAKLKMIKIGLNVKTITSPEILKTIIMITNYKNLKQGMHEFGETVYFNA